MKQPKNKKQSFTKTGESKKQRTQEASTVSKLPKNKNGGNNIIWILGGIIVLTVIVYWRAIGNGFTNWDDDEYIIENTLIRSFNLKAIFTHYLSGNYHPITELVLAIEYHFWGLKESGYHIVSLVLHICNAIFVFYAVLHLSKKTEIAAVTCLLFAIHPMHVESVAWVAELKDLLYTFFFFASYLCYLKFTTNRQWLLYIFSVLLFAVSLLSKAMAASLPVLLVLTDYFMGRKITAKTLLEKAPFFALSVVFGIIAIYAQRSVGGIQEVAVFPFYHRAVFACYGFIMYFCKLVLPLELCAFYPYPVKSIAGIPSWYYLFPVFMLVLAAAVTWSLRYTKKVVFGIGFFAITIFLVLQLLPVGMAIMADRYSYIPSVGFFYLAAEGFYWLWNKRDSSFAGKTPAIVLLAAAGAFFSYTTYDRCAIWKGGMTLWNDMIGKYENIPFAHNNRAILYMNKEQYEEAMKDLNRAIQLEPAYPHALNNRGIILSKQKKFEEAKYNFDQAIKYQHDYEEAYANRGIMFIDSKRYEEAIYDFSKEIELKPNAPTAYYNRARAEISLGKTEVACADLRRAIDLNFPAAEDAFKHFCH